MKLQAEFALTQRKLIAIDEELKNAPSGRLVKKGDKYYHAVNRIEAGITNRSEFIARLARKKYLLTLRKMLEMGTTMSALKSSTMINCEPRELISGLSSTFQNVPYEFFFHPTVVPWQREEYIQNSYRIEEKKYESNQGVLVRSKSELIIANLLEDFVVPYRYDAEFTIKGKKMYPDFIIKKPFTGETVIWEHFGALHLEGYERRMNEKMQAYLTQGLVPFATLIYTFEFDLTKTRLEKLIKELVLSY